MRALLVVNPTATTTTARTRDVIAAALGGDLKVDVAETTRRGHAAELAARARVDGLDVVVALGGDGTVNEVVNGLLRDGPSGAVPDLAVVPGGCTNVLARALGLPPDPVEATALVLDAVRSGRRRRIGLGRADDRWFTFGAGMGLSAEVVAAVERRRAAGAASTSGLYVRTAVRQFYRGSDRRRPALTVERPGHPPETGLHLAIVVGTAPWTYAGRRPVNPCPRASLDAGLDLFALRRMSTPVVLRHTRQILARSGAEPHGRHLLRLHDEPELLVRATRPVRLEVDGDDLGPRTAVRLTAHPAALAVLA